MSRRLTPILMFLVLAGVVARFLAFGFGLPDVYYKDEDDVVEAAMYTLTGDPNPRLYKYPNLIPLLVSGALHLKYGIGPGATDRERLDALLAHQRDPSGDRLLARILVGALGLLGVFGAFRIARALAGEQAGWIAALLVTVSPLHFEIGRVARVDAPAAGFAALALALLLPAPSRMRVFAAGACIGLAASCKYYAGAAMLSAIPLVWLQSRHRVRDTIRLAVFAALAFVATSPFPFLAWEEFLDETVRLSRHYEVDYWGEEGAATLLAQLGPLARYGPGLLGLLGLLMALGKNGGSRSLRFALLAFPVALLLFFLPSRTFFLRFYLPAVPVLLGVAAVGLTRPKARLLWIPIAAAALLYALDFGDTIRFSVFENDPRVRCRKWIEANAPHTPLVLGPRRFSPWFASTEEPLPHEPRFLLRRLADRRPEWAAVLDSARASVSAVIRPSRPVTYARGRESSETWEELVRGAVVVVPVGNAKLESRRARDKRRETLAVTHERRRFFRGGWVGTLGTPLEVWVPRPASPGS